jgi:hypothetical protein
LRHNTVLGITPVKSLYTGDAPAIKSSKRSMRPKGFADGLITQMLGPTWHNLHSSGDNIDFMLSPTRDLTAARLFLRQALLTRTGLGTSAGHQCWIGAHHILVRSPI